MDINQLKHFTTENKYKLRNRINFIGFYIIYFESLISFLELNYNTLKSTKIKDFAKVSNLLSWARDDLKIISNFQFNRLLDLKETRNKLTHEFINILVEKKEFLDLSLEIMELRTIYEIVVKNFFNIQVLEKIDYYDFEEQITGELQMINFLYDDFCNDIIQTEIRKNVIQNND